MIGAVLSLSNSNRTCSVRVDTAGIGGAGAGRQLVDGHQPEPHRHFVLQPDAGRDHRRRTRCRQTNTNPPLIRVAQGNFALWNANERCQCQWSEESNNLQSGLRGGVRSNGNQAALSEIDASAENPSQTRQRPRHRRRRKGEYIARVQACVAGASSARETLQAAIRAATTSRSGCCRSTATST